MIAQGRVSVVAIDNIFEVPYKDDRQKTIRVYISKLVFAKKGSNFFCLLFPPSIGLN